MPEPGVVLAASRADDLLFGEATSALDSEIEDAVMWAIPGRGRGLTILMIAHRLLTVGGCDQIVRLDAGHVVVRGTYDEVVGSAAAGDLFQGSAVACVVG